VGPGGSARALCPVAHGHEVRVEDRVGGELDLQGARVRRAVVVEILQRTQQALMPGVVSTQEVFATSASPDKSYANRPACRRNEADGLQQRIESLLQLPGGDERAGEGDQ
jgi:hypothetical protein